ncbi:type II toxin-antitoxin system mRNA interferase toxin, RelE/StbE family [Gloeocapsa sp. PCC 73106]|uniref:type II toxin-antitoxin system RelE/ParE family toxin n=1 Tax=Gloeocapsa sp. PCC 73106 TaxID=102232 RepID=UPI0002ACD33F|nr:type II toxin-antitoxin system mRNA interferase toxin, RelE/StbE family [Gloeocapsa sp. PCC 73106]ELR98153.1 addiction module toxin, RelE/StbE family [Gloeocapsa sp. PCC 73106]
MAYQIVWSSQAIEDIDAIAIYIARDSPSYAAAIVRKLIDEIRQLKNHPMMGKTVFEFEEPSIKEVWTYSYRVIYQVHEETITIATVVHGKALLSLEG